MSSRVWMSVVLVLTAVVTQGCGTIFNGRQQKLFIESSPTQASFRITSAGLEGMTPATIKLRRKEYYTVIVAKEGYNTKGFLIERKVAWFPLMLDIVCWPGFLVDFATGGAYELRPSQLFVELEKQ